MKDVAQDMCMHIAHVLRLVDTETSEDVQALVLVPDVQVQGVQKLCTCRRGEHCIGASVESNCGSNGREVLATNCEALALQASGSCDDFSIEFDGSNSGLV